MREGRPVCALVRRLAVDVSFLVPALMLVTTGPLDTRRFQKSPFQLKTLVSKPGRRSAQMAAAGIWIRPRSDRAGVATRRAVSYRITK